MPAMYMSIPGIPGDATAPRHTGKIDVLSCGWSFDRLIDPSTGALASPVLPRLIRLAKVLDRSSPLLAQAASTAAALASCDIQCFTPGERPVLIWRLLLSNCRVESFSQGLNAFGSTAPIEDIAFSYASLQVDTGDLSGSNRYTFKA